MDAKGVVIRVSDIHIGTLTASMVGAREVFREAIRDGACSLIIGHNHPSGDTTPSPEDIRVTKELVQLGEMLDIKVEDHVIVGDTGYTSLKQERLM
jgi:DNA repair protein RadC